MSYSTLVAFSATVIFAVLSAGSGKVLNEASDAINDPVVQNVYLKSTNPNWARMVDYYHPYTALRVQDRVSLALNFEALSIYSMRSHIILRLAADQVGLENLDMYYHPFGNAKISEKDGKTIIECEHGTIECYFNKIIACAIDILKDPDTYIRYNECVLMYTVLDHTEDIDNCTTKFNVDGKSIKECAASDRGFQLLKYHGEETLKLNVTHIPSVYMNGKVVNNDDDEIVLAQQICEEFIVKPKGCQKPSEEADKVLSHAAQSLDSYVTQ